MFKNSSLKETGPGYNERFLSSDNPRKNICHKIEKYKKTGQGFKNVISHFACFIDSYSQRLPKGPLGTRLRLHPHLTFLQYFLIS